MDDEFGIAPGWEPQPPRYSPLRLVLSWLVAAASLFVAAAVVPGVSVTNFFPDALVAAALIAVLNAVLPPVVAGLRLPFTLALGFVLVLFVNAAVLMLVAAVDPNAFAVSSFGWALLAAVVMSAATAVIQEIIGADDDDTYSLRVTRRIARRSGETVRTDVPGLIFLEIDGLALPVLRHAMQSGHAPTLESWLRDGSHEITEWETDLSSQTGASQAGILLGSNEDIPAFRWVEKESGRMMTCSAPADCAEIERRHAGRGLLRGGGASRGNLLSGEADEVILTVSRMEAEKRSNPGYRAFLANGFNVTRVLVLFLWEVVLELAAAARQRRRGILPRGHRGGIYPLLRAAVCVFVRDLIVFGVISDMMRGRPVMYATFSSYDEVAHHSGLERHDTLEALFKLDEHFRRIARACRHAPRPYRIVVLSDHGQTQGATFKQRNGYGLDELVARSLSTGRVKAAAGGDETDMAATRAVQEATGRVEEDAAQAGEAEVHVLGSGNLGLVYLMEESRRLTMQELDERHPKLLGALREHPHVGFVMVRCAQRGAVALGARGVNYLSEGRVEGEDPLAPFGARAAEHLLRTDGFEHAPDILVNSFYDAKLDEGCAFEELICFHGGLGGAQTRPFIIHPADLAVPAQEIVGAAAVYEVLSGWRTGLQGEEWLGAVHAAGAAG
jgi:uncharacterized membrane protein YvlD (DUF360 family)